MTEQLAEVEKEQARLAEAIALTGGVDALAAGLNAREVRRVALTRELAALDAVGTELFDDARVLQDLTQRVADFKALIRRQTPVARQALSRLLDGRILCTPNAADHEYRYAGNLKADQLLAGVVSTTNKVAHRVTSPRGNAETYGRVRVRVARAA